MKASLVIPSYGGGPNIERTISSCRDVCDEVIIISAALFESDVAHFKTIANQVIELPWNFVFLHGFGSLHNQASNYAKNDWLLLLGVAETLAQEYMPLNDVLRNSGADLVFRCNHANDPHTWKRIWNRAGGPMWSGIIHEEIAMGKEGQILFRMQDTEKVPDADAFRNEVRKYIKTCSYHWLYEQLARKPERLGATNAGWLDFVNGSIEAREVFLNEHADLLQAAIEGDKEAFLKGVETRLNAQQAATGVNFAPQGQPQSDNQVVGVKLDTYASGGYETTFLEQKQHIVSNKATTP
jgi:glycosyltransferase involved in cell wall biosynthesis